MHSHFDFPGETPRSSVFVSGPIINALVKDFSEITYATRIRKMSPTIKHNQDVFSGGISFVDADVLNIFDFNTVEGNLESALADKSSLALSLSRAKTYFGDESAIGEVLTLSQFGLTRDYKVAAVYEDLPTNSQIDLSAMMLIDENDWLDQSWMFNSWFANGLQLYFTIGESANIAAIEERFPNFIDNNFPAPSGNSSISKFSNSITLSAMNVQDLHLDAVGEAEYIPRGNIVVVWTFSAIALFLLLIASINFMNLSTARAGTRAKEVALRKVSGASKSDLVIQFLGESLVMVLLALLVGLTLAEVMLPAYNHFLNKTYVLNYFSSEMLLIVVATLTMGLITGSYPAFVLSSFRPAKILMSNKSTETSSTSVFRTLLVVIQFSFSIALFTATGVVYSQMQYIKDKDMGFNPENLLIITGSWSGNAVQKQQVIVNALRQHSQTISVTQSSNVPPYDSGGRSTYLRTETMDRNSTLAIGQRRVGQDFFKTFEIPILAGRTYDLDHHDQIPAVNNMRTDGSETRGIIINEGGLALFALGSPEEAIGKTLYMPINTGSTSIELKLRVIGVIPDVHFSSLHTTIRPEVFFLSEEATELRIITARITGNPQDTISYLDTIWQNAVSDVPFYHNFIDEMLASQYEEEERQATILTVFSLLAILIACLGLYGLASFAAERRAKEIGLRKVMGANVANIVGLLIWQFSKPVFFANLIALPLAFYFSNKWLNTFVYRIEPSSIVVLGILGGVTALFIAWATVGGNAAKVARTNPIKALRSE